MGSRKRKAASIKTKTSVAGRTDPGKAKVTNSRNKRSPIETLQPGAAEAAGLSELRAVLAKLNAPGESEDVRAFAIVLIAQLDRQERNLRLVGTALAHIPSGGLSGAPIPPSLTAMERTTDSLVRTALFLGGLKDKSRQLKKFHEQSAKRARDARSEKLKASPEEMAFQKSVAAHAKVGPHPKPHKYADSILAQVNADLGSANFALVTIEKVRWRLGKIGVLPVRRRK